MKRTDPFRNFRFRVEIDGLQSAAFTEATIPDTSTEAIDYREGIDPPTFRKLSGATKFGNITLKRGMSESMEIANWRRQVELLGATAARRHMSLILIDEEGNDKCRWDVINAWPTKYDVGDFNASGNEVMIETMEIVHEGMTRIK